MAKLTLAVPSLDWAFDGDALVIKCRAFKHLLGVDTICVSRKEVLI